MSRAANTSYTKLKRLLMSANLWGGIFSRPENVSGTVETNLTKIYQARTIEFSAWGIFHGKGNASIKNVQKNHTKATIRRRIKVQFQI